MFERFKFGTYRFEDIELANTKKIKSNKGLNNLILVKLLDNSNVKFNLEVSTCSRLQELSQPHDSFLTFQKKAKGCDLLDKVFTHLELTERDYFGLKFCQTDCEVSHTTEKERIISPCNQTIHFLIITFSLAVAMVGSQ